MTPPPKDSAVNTGEEREALDTLVMPALLRLRRYSPFFATLASYAEKTVTRSVPTAATDGRRLYFNPAFFGSLTREERGAVALHEVIHAALLHVARRGARDPVLWNYAADVVVNGLIAAETQRMGVGAYALPAGHVREMALEHLSVEEVYARLREREDQADLVATSDLLDAPPEGAAGDTDPPSGRGVGARAAAQRRSMEGLGSYWRHALEQALSVARAQGDVGAGLRRELDMARPGRLDWRSALWRFLVLTPSDFGAFDRRFVWRGLYLEELASMEARVLVAVDTSGSVGPREFTAFMAEVEGITQAYPQLEVSLYYADAALYGPHALSAGAPAPPARGGGGTRSSPMSASGVPSNSLSPGS